MEPSEIKISEILGMLGTLPQFNQENLSLMKGHLNDLVILAREEQLNDVKEKFNVED